MKQFNEKSYRKFRLKDIDSIKSSIAVSSSSQNIRMVGVIEMTGDKSIMTTSKTAEESYRIFES